MRQWNRMEWDNIQVKGRKKWLSNSFCKVFKMLNITCYNIAELKSRGVVSSPCCHCMIQWSLLSQNTERLIGWVMRYHISQDCGLHSSLLWFKWNKDVCYELATQLTKAVLHYQKNNCGDNCSVLFQSMQCCTIMTVPDIHQFLKYSPMATTKISKQWRLMCLSYGKAAARVIIRLIRRA